MHRWGSRQDLVADGEFIALATGSNSNDDSRKGRGILVLIRQPQP